MDASGVASMITRLKVWALLLGAMISLIIAVRDQSFVMFLIAFLIGFVFHEEKCPSCGFLVWRRKPEKMLEFVTWGPIWISGTCKKCGHKHR